MSKQVIKIIEKHKREEGLTSEDIDNLIMYIYKLAKSNQFTILEAKIYKDFIFSEGLRNKLNEKLNNMELEDGN